ncbi:GNAT family N-acetyltransferase, partial [candidate division GN15 bacterium]
MISPLKTDRLILIPAEIRHLEAEVEKSQDLSDLLRVAVPDNWPPEILRDALPYFLKQLRERPSSIGWNCWYWIRQATGSEPAVLIGDGGFVAPPDAEGEVEMGHSVLPQYQGQGFATEAAT